MASRAVTNPLMFGGIYKGRRVFVTGHTGFKGSWLALWLLELGAHVGGYSLEPPTDPSNFDCTRLASRIVHFIGDVRDRARLASAIDEFKPDIVFHLAAQALVRKSYADPVTTFETNAMGTLNVLDALRARPGIGAAVFVTSDKCYRNAEWVWGYRESDTLGGEDPYSGSKACAELIAYSYFHSYFKAGSGLAALATARAGNVIGGGDWAPDRIVPDAMRAWTSNSTLTIRHPKATRPWQHVLEPLSGYLWLGHALWSRRERVVGGAYNFGPDTSVTVSVEALLEIMAAAWPGAAWRIDEEPRGSKPESTLLKLSCDKSLADLAWQATLTFEESVGYTAAWYRRFYDHRGSDMFDFAVQQIREYAARARSRGYAWAEA